MENISLNGDFMFTKQKLLKIDKNYMYHKILHMPEQVYLAYKCEMKNPIKTGVKRVILSGMGGSGISSFIAKSVFGKDISIDIFSDYSPLFIDKNTLFITSSYSGNTSETLSSFDIAKKHTDNIVVISTGGKLLKRVSKKYPFIKLEKDKYPPRTSICYQFFAIVKILEHYQLIKSQKDVVKRLLPLLSYKTNALCLNSKYNIAHISAKKIMGRTPIIYSTSPELFPAAYRLKCQFNEMADYPAFASSLPEAFHNEVQSFDNKMFKNNFIPIILSDFSKRAIKERKKLIKSFGKMEYLEFYAEGKTLIEKIFSLIYLGDMISYYLAIELKVDPYTIDIITKIKD